MLRKIIALAAVMILLAGCIDFLRYSESGYKYTITVPKNGTILCEFTTSRPTNVSYELYSDTPLDLRLVSVVIATDPATGTESVTYTELRSIKAEQNLYSYSDKIMLEEGLYDLVLYGCGTTSHITLTSDVKMDCG